MDLSTWLLYSIVALANIASPGPAIVFAIGNSINFGPSKVVFSSLGNIAGLFLLSSVTMIGLGTLLNTSAFLFMMLKLLGAGYLFYLGIRHWFSKTNVFAKADELPLAKRPSDRQTFVRGFLLAATNLKPILFFSALFPQFMKPNEAILPQFFLLTGTFMMLSFCSLMSYALLAHSAKRLLSNNRRLTWFNRATGAIFISLGIGMLRLRRAHS